MATLQTGPYELKRGDLDPPLLGYIQGAQKKPLNLSAAVSVRFVMRKRGATVAKVDAAGSIVDGPLGVVSYQWQGDDTDTSGVYDAEWVIHWPDGHPQRVPNNGYLQIIILGDLS